MTIEFRNRRRSVPTAVLLIAALMQGCAINPAPAQQLVDAKTAIATAGVGGAAELAPRDLQAARDKAKLSERWIAAKDHEPARWLAEQAQVDAELARVKAAAIQANIAAAQAQESLQALRLNLRGTSL